MGWKKMNNALATVREPGTENLYEQQRKPQFGSPALMRSIAMWNAIRFLRESETLPS